MNLHNLGCCGIKEIVSLSSWPGNRSSFYHLLTLYAGQLPCAWICFNGVEKGGYVAEFAQFLEAEHLGTVITLPPAINPNSKNVLDVRMWQIDRNALLNWYIRRQAIGPCDCADCLYLRRCQEAGNQYHSPSAPAPPAIARAPF